MALIHVFLEEVNVNSGAPDKVLSKKLFDLVTRLFSYYGTVFRREKFVEEDTSKAGSGIGSILKLVSFSSRKKVKSRRESRDIFSSDGEKKVFCPSF